jgi:hypothetical protein
MGLLTTQPRSQENNQHPGKQLIEFFHQMNKPETNVWGISNTVSRRRFER